MQIAPESVKLPLAWTPLIRTYDVMCASCTYLTENFAHYFWWPQTHWTFFVGLMYLRDCSQTLVGAWCKKEGILKNHCNFSTKPWLKGCGMGPWLVLVSPCFRENVVGTCKIWSFLCSLDNLLQKNVIVLFFGNQIWKWRSFEKKGYFWSTFHIF